MQLGVPGRDRRGSPSRRHHGRSSGSPSSSVRTGRCGEPTRSCGRRRLFSDSCASPVPGRSSKRACRGAHFVARAELHRRHQSAGDLITSPSARPPAITPESYKGRPRRAAEQSEQHRAVPVAAPDRRDADSRCTRATSLHGLTANLRSRRPGPTPRARFPSPPAQRAAPRPSEPRRRSTPSKSPPEVSRVPAGRVE